MCGGLSWRVMYQSLSSASLMLPTRDVKSCQIRHPEVRIRYPDTSERSHRIASYVLVNVCMVYVRPYCRIYDIFETIMTRPPQLHRNETFCKLKQKTCLSPKI